MRLCLASRTLLRPRRTRRPSGVRLSACLRLATVLLAAGCSSNGAAGADARTGDGGTGDATAADARAIDAAPAVPAVHFVGRHDDSNPDRVRFGWPGTGMVIRFRGTGASVVLDDPAGYFALVVDGEVKPRLETTPGERSYPLASDLAEGEHTVELYRRTEGFFGPTSFLGEEIVGDLLAVPPPTRRIEILGDSITCGYGNEGPDQYCNFSAETENHFLTYGAIAARALGAELSTIAWSGKGVIYNYGDDTVEPLPELFDRTLPTSAAPVWGFAWQPDVVVINLGTNDFSTNNDPGELLFVGAYVALLERLRERYPGALILCTVAPLLGEPDRTTVITYLDSAIAQRAAAGDTLVERIDLSVPTEGWGCDWHPSIATHESMAQALIAILQARLSW